MEGMQAFAARHFASLDPADTRSSASTPRAPTLMQLEGEGMRSCATTRRGWTWSRARGTRRSPAAPAAALPQRHRRPDRDEGRVPAVMLGSMTGSRPPNYHWPTTRRPTPTSAPRPGVRRSASRRRARRSAGASPAPSPTASSRVATSPAYAPRRSREQLAEPRARPMPELARELVAAHQRRRPPAGFAVQRSGRASRATSRCRRSPPRLAPAGGEPVGDPEDVCRDAGSQAHQVA